MGFCMWCPENGGFWSLNPSSLNTFCGICKSHRGVITLILAYTSVPCRLLDMSHSCELLGSRDAFYSNLCYGNQKKCVFWNPTPDFPWVVNSTFSHISHRFRVICFFCLQWDFHISGTISPLFGPWPQKLWIRSAKPQKGRLTHYQCLPGICFFRRWVCRVIQIWCMVSIAFRRWDICDIRGKFWDT